MAKFLKVDYGNRQRIINVDNIVSISEHSVCTTDGKQIMGTCIIDTLGHELVLSCNYNFLVKYMEDHSSIMEV